MADIFFLLLFIRQVKNNGQKITSSTQNESISISRQSSSIMTVDLSFDNSISLSLSLFFNL